MTRTLILLVSGLLLSGGVLTLLRAVFPRALPLSATLEAIDAGPLRSPGDRFASPNAHGAAIVVRGGGVAHRVLTQVGLDLNKQRADLRLLHLSTEQFAFYKLAGALLGALSGAVLAVFVVASGMTVGSSWLLVAAVAAAVLGFLLPDRLIEQRAAEARVDFNAAFTAYLELVRTLIAGGMNVQGALHVAAQAGEGPAFNELVVAIDRASTAGSTIAAEFHRLAEDAELPEVALVASSLELAAEQGAAPGDALSSRAETLTNRRAYEERELAEQATAKMSIPTALLALGYVVLLGAPAIAAIFSSTGSATLP